MKVVLYFGWIAVVALVAAWLINIAPKEATFPIMFGAVVVYATGYLLMFAGADSKDEG